MDKELASGQVLVVSIQDTDAGPPIQELPPLEAAAEYPVGGGSKREWEKKGSIQDPGPLGRHEVQPVLDFLSTTDVRRRAPPTAEVSSPRFDRPPQPPELREWRERGEERRVEAEELGAGGEEHPLFLPTPSFMASAEEE
jgi:hypothetical protein